MKKTCKSALFNFVRTLGLDAVGITGDGLTYSKIVCLFPYYVGKNEDSNISMYAYAPDYHKTVSMYLEKIADYILQEYPAATTKTHVDIGQGDDRAAAFFAGLGFYGKNNLFISPKYGSFVFIGYVETNVVFEPDTPFSSHCLACNACIKTCPGGALTEGNFDETKCASYISQKRGTLSPEEKAILKKSGLAWGCDACQVVCPHNKDIPKTPLAAFSEGLSYQIEPISLSNRAFQSDFQSRAYVWRGKQVLNRNLEILSTDNDEDA